MDDTEMERRFHQIDRRLHQIDRRFEPLEKHDKEFELLFYQTCDIKSKEVSTARDDAIKAANEYSKNNHIQTLWLITGMFGLFISAVAYVGLLSNGITAAKTDIDNIKHSIDRMDNKLDQLISKDRK